jgi:hypothetical protein
MSTDTLAGAFATAMTATPKPAALLRAPHPAAFGRRAGDERPFVTLEAQVIPMQKREPVRKLWMDDDLLLIALQHSLTPGDQIMARRTLLRPAPWEVRAA